MLSIFSVKIHETVIMPYTKILGTRHSTEGSKDTTPESSSAKPDSKIHLAKKRKRGRPKLDRKKDDIQLISCLKDAKPIIRTSNQ
jgi:hypothetical protein